MGHKRIGLLIAALFTLISASASPEKSWFRLVGPDGAQLGFIWQSSEQGKDGRRQVEVSETRTRETNYPVRHIIDRTEKIEDATGRPLRIEQVSTIGKTSSHTNITIFSDYAIIIRAAGGDSRRTRVSLPAGVRFDNGTRLLREWSFVAKPRLEFDQFNASAGAVEHVVIEPLFPPLAGEGLSLIRKSFAGEDLRSVSRLDLDSRQRLLRSTQMMFGMRISIEPAGPEAATFSGPPFSILRGAMVKSPFRVSPRAALGHIRYQFGYQDGIVFPFPQTGEQRASLERGIAIVDICPACASPVSLTSAQRAAALASTPWMQSDHPRLIKAARPISVMKVSDTEKMRLLGVIARSFLTRIDFAGHFSALEAMQRGAGDCTEDAVLLAALGRAAGIPTRVANGLVYSRERYHGVSNVFMPHSWTLAWIDGRWQSFDISVGGFDATHIALAVGDGDTRTLSAANQLTSLLDWQGMIEVRRKEDP